MDEDSNRLLKLAYDRGYESMQRHIREAFEEALKADSDLSANKLYLLLKSYEII